MLCVLLGVLIGNPYVNLGSLFAGGITALWGMQLIPLPLWEDAVSEYVVCVLCGCMYNTV